ncbi:hypothetical protein ACJX0J_023288, partial [Zea mays]
LQKKQLQRNSTRRSPRRSQRKIVTDWSCLYERRGNRRHSESDRGDATWDSCRVDGPSTGGGGEIITGWRGDTNSVWT